MTIARKSAILHRIDVVIERRAALITELAACRASMEGTDWYAGRSIVLVFLCDRLARLMNQLSVRQQQEIIPRITMEFA